MHGSSYLLTMLSKSCGDASLTIISSKFLYVCANMLSIHSAKNCALYAGTVTLNFISVIIMFYVQLCIHCALGTLIFMYPNSPLGDSHRTGSSATLILRLLYIFSIARVKFFTLTPVASNFLK